MNTATYVAVIAKSRSTTKLACDEQMRSHALDLTIRDLPITRAGIIAASTGQRIA
jgi:hypothetical protein